MIEPLERICSRGDVRDSRYSVRTRSSRRLCSFAMSASVFAICCAVAARSSSSFCSRSLSASSSTPRYLRMAWMRSRSEVACSASWAAATAAAVLASIALAELVGDGDAALLAEGLADADGLTDAEDVALGEVDGFGGTFGDAGGELLCGGADG